MLKCGVLSLLEFTAITRYLWKKIHLFTQLSLDHVKIYSMVRMCGLGFARDGGEQ